MEKMKIVFMGTPAFGATILEELIKEFDVCLVVTQPDKTVGRKNKIVYSPVKEKAIEHKIDCFQPLNIRKEYEYIINNYDFDLIVTAAYGQIIGTKLLNYPKYKSINVHASLLPKYRGGAPIQRAIMNGEKKTGITIMYMAKGMDSGDILRQEEIEIMESDTSDSMFLKLALLGKEMINNTIKDLVNGLIKPIKQNEDEVTYAYNITKEEERISFLDTSYNIYNKIRGLCSNPGCYFILENIKFKVYSSKISHLSSHLNPGTIIDVNKESFTISCLDATSLTISSFKPEGKGIMTVKDYLNGKGKEILRVGRKIE